MLYTLLRSAARRRRGLYTDELTAINTGETYMDIRDKALKPMLLGRAVDAPMTVILLGDLE